MQLRHFRGAQTAILVELAYVRPYSPQMLIWGDGATRQYLIIQRRRRVVCVLCVCLCECTEDRVCMCVLYLFYTGITPSNNP